MILKTGMSLRLLIFLLAFPFISCYITAENPSIKPFSPSTATSSTVVDPREYKQLKSLLVSFKKNGASSAEIVEKLTQIKTPAARLVLEEFLTSLEHGYKPHSDVSRRCSHTGIVEDLFWATTAGVMIYWFDTKKALAVAGAAGVFLAYRFYRRFNS